MSDYVLGTCGACIAFMRDGADDEGPRGRCRLRPELGVYSHTLPRCAKYIERGTGATWKPPKVARPRGRSLRDEEETAPAPRPKLYGPTIDLGGDNMDTQALRALIHDILYEEGVVGETPIGKKWEGGTLVLKPSSAELQPKEVPIDAFFHKIVMLRDRLRTLEQKINSHPGLAEADKIDLQQYLTRCYGSLTTFNVLFRDKADQFTGAKGE